MKKTKETWKPITCTDNVKYEVSSEGKVRSLKTGRILKPCYNTKGYARVDLTSANIDKTKKTRKLVHRLVAQAFIPNPNNLPEVNHINEDKLDNEVENLEWLSRIDNMRHGTVQARLAEKAKQTVEVLDSAGTVIEVCRGLKDTAMKYNTTNYYIKRCSEDGVDLIGRGLCKVNFRIR